MRNIFLLLIITLLTVCGSLSAEVEKKVRIAIIADKSSALFDSPLIPLLETKLSELDNVQLLERQHIATIIKEHKLSLSGMVKRESVIKAGKLLRADALMLLSLEESQKGGKDGLLRVRIVETAHGIRLADTFESSDSKSLEQTAERTAGKLKLAAQKLSVSPEESIAVGIIDVQRAGLGDKHKRLANVLPALLSSRLSKEPRLIILEREDLKLLLDEKLLTTGANKDFLNSAILINGHIQPNGKEGLQFKLSLKAANKQSIAEFSTSLDPDNPATTVDEVSVNIIKELLKTNPTTSWNPKAEAEEFYNHGQNLTNHQQYWQARSLLETAHALQPDNVHYISGLFENEWDARSEMNNKKSQTLYSDLELAQVVALLINQIQREYQSGSMSADEIMGQWVLTGSYNKEIIYYFRSSSSASSEQVRKINRQSRRICMDLFQPILKKRRDDYFAFNVAMASSDDPEEVMVNLKKILSELILPPEMGGRYKSPETRYRNVANHMGVTKPAHLLHQQEKFRILWKKYLQELTESKDLLVSIKACENLATFERSWSWSEYARSSEAKLQAKRYIIKAYKKMPEILENYTLSEWNKSQIFGIVTFKYDQIVGFEKDEYLTLLKNTIEPMIEQKQVDRLVCWDNRYCRRMRGCFDTTEKAKSYIKFLERIAQVFQDSGNYEKFEVDCLRHIRDFQALIVNETSGLKLSNPKPTFPVTMLLSKKDSLLDSKSCKVHTVLDGNMLWVGFFEAYGNNTDGVVLAGIDLDKKQTVSQWRSYTGSKGSFRKNSVAIGKDATYASVMDFGIIEFPGTETRGRGVLKDHKILTAQNGLPSVHITSIAREKDKLWVAYGKYKQECGLGMYDLKAGTWETVFSSSLKDDPVFEDGKQFFIVELNLAKPNELFFYGRGILSSISSYYYLNPKRPLWKLNTKTRELEKVSSDVRKQMEKEMQRILDAEKRIGEGHSSRCPAALHDNRFWGRSGWSKIFIVPKGKGREHAEIIDNNILEGGKVLKFLSTKYGLIAIGEGTVGLIETGK